MSKVSRLLGAVLALAFAGAVGATPLSALIQQGGSLTVGDKLFDRWVLRGLTDSTGQVDLSRIDVTGFVAGSEVGLRFDAGGQLALSGDNLIDLFFGYRVSVLPGSGMQINGVSFDFDSGSFAQDGFHAATEDIFDAANNPLGSIDLEASRQLFKISGSASFNPTNEIFVQKNILLFGFADGDSTSLNAFTQRFFQVPVPASAWLLAAAGLAWLGARRRTLGR